MARYIVNNALFNPIDFQTRLKPLEAYAKSYTENQNALDTIGTKATDILSMLSDMPEDQGLKDIYNEYQNKVDEAATKLSKSGDIKEARRAIADLTKDYGEISNPIKSAYNVKQADIARYDKAIEKDNTYLGIDPRTRSTLSYMYRKGEEGQKDNYPKTSYGVSGSTLYSVANQDAKAESARRVIIDKYKLSKGLLNQYFIEKTQTGYINTDLAGIDLSTLAERAGNNLTEEDKKNLKEAESYILDAYERIAGQSGIEKFNTSETQDLYQQANNYIINGLLGGLTGSIKSDALQNRAFIVPGTQQKSSGTPITTPTVTITGSATTAPTRNTKNPKVKQTEADREYSSKVYEKPDGTYTTADIDAIEREIESYNKDLDGYTYRTGIVDRSTGKELTQEELSKLSGEDWVDLNRRDKTSSLEKKYYKEKDGVATEINRREYNKYSPISTKKVQAENKRNALNKELEDFKARYSAFNAPGVKQKDSIDLGIRVNRATLNMSNTTYNPELNGSEGTRLKDRVINWIADVIPSKMDNSVAGTSGGLYDMDGKSLNKKTIEAIKGLKSSDITSISEILNDNREFEGLRIVTSADGVPREFIIKPSNNTWKNHANEMWAFKRQVLEFNDSIKDVPVYRESEFNNIWKDIPNKLVSEGKVKPIAGIRDYYITTAKVIREDGSYDIIRTILQKVGDSFNIVGNINAQSLDAPDSIDGTPATNVYWDIITALSHEFFKNLAQSSEKS